jgi:hypothetical protein
MGWSPVQGVIPTVYRKNYETEKAARAQQKGVWMNESGSSKFSASFTFSYHKFICISFFSHGCYTLFPSFDRSINIWRRVQVMNLLEVQLYPASCHFIPRRSRCSPSLSLSLSPVAPTWSTGHPGNASFHFSFLNLRESVGLLGRGISPSQGRYLHTGQHRHPCLGGIRTHVPSVRASEDSSYLSKATVIGVRRHRPVEVR